MAFYFVVEKAVLNMSEGTRPLFGARTPVQLRKLSRKWAIRRDIPIALLAWIALVAVILWAASHIVRTILVLAIAALLAFALAPAVKLLQRIMPRFLAILVVYLVVLSGISVLCYLIVNATIEQVFTLSFTIRRLLGPGAHGMPTPIDQALTTLGITPDQIAQARQQIVTQVEEFAKNSLPYLRSLFDFVIDTIVVAVLSIYLLVDGSRVAAWVRTNAPQAARARFFLDTLQRVLGAYIRGQLTLALLIGVLVGAGMQFIFHLHYALFLGVLAFVMAFIPVLGTIISGALCVIIGLTQGWLVAVGVLVYFVVIHVIEGELVGPRIVGQAIGLHPVVSLLALVAGAELFGVWGALFASPLAGVLQAIIVSLWTEWRDQHPEQFQITQEEEAQPEETPLQKEEETITPPSHLPPA
jgi:predicted PurR-regulated permease PerM